MSTDSADGNYKISIFKIIKHIRDIIKHERKRKTIKDQKKKKDSIKRPGRSEGKEKTNRILYEHWNKKKYTLG